MPGFARAIDRLQPLPLHGASDGAAWAARGIAAGQERRLMAVYVAAFTSGINSSGISKPQA
jgi:hypothetical protein